MRYRPPDSVPHRLLYAAPGPCRYVQDSHAPHRIRARSPAIALMFSARCQNPGFQSADLQFDAQKDLVMQAKDPAERTAYAEKANTILDNANLILQAEENKLKMMDYL